MQFLPIPLALGHTHLIKGNVAPSYSYFLPPPRF